MLAYEGHASRRPVLGASAKWLPEANFYEKALFVKPTWRPLCGVSRLLCPWRAMLLFALSMSSLFGGSVHRMGSVFSGQRRCDLPIGLASFRVDQVRWRSRLTRSEAIGQR